jgi:hypothetical protein
VSGGPDVNDADNEENTPVLKAVNKGNLERLDINVLVDVDKNGHTCLMRGLMLMLQPRITRSSHHCCWLSPRGLWRAFGCW